MEELKSLEVLKQPVEFTELAAPVAVKVILPEGTVQTVMDRYWEEVKDKLPAGLVQKAMKGFRSLNRDRVVTLSGGNVQFYRGAIIDHINSLKYKHDGREILVWGDIAIDGDTVNGIAFLEPTVTFRGFVPPRFTVKLPSVDMEETIIDRMVNDEIQRLQAVHTVEGAVMEPDDSLAAAAGYENLEQMKIQLARNMENRRLAEREDLAILHAITQLAERATVGPVPELWSRGRAYRALEQQKAQLGGEANIKKFFGGVEYLFQRNMYEAAQGLIRQLILRQYGIEANQHYARGIEGSTDLGNAHIFTDAVRKSILKDIQTEEDQEPTNEQSAS